MTKVWRRYGHLLSLRRTDLDNNFERHGTHAGGFPSVSTEIELWFVHGSMFGRVPQFRLAHHQDKNWIVSDYSPSSPWLSSAWLLWRVLHFCPEHHTDNNWVVDEHSLLAYPYFGPVYHKDKTWVASDHCLDPLLCVLYMGQNLQGSMGQNLQGSFVWLACHQDTHWVMSDHDSRSTWLCGLCMGQTYTCAQPRGRSQIICMLMLFCPAYRLDNNCIDIDEQMHLSSFSEKTKDIALNALILPSISGLPWWDPANTQRYHAHNIVSFRWSIKRLDHKDNVLKHQGADKRPKKTDTMCSERE